MSTFITRLDGAGAGPRLAVTDLIDVAGVPTTAGSRAVQRRAKPAQRDALCLAGARAAGARIVGKANLHELSMLPIGTNPWFGNPTNPVDGGLIPGGSSSGCAVAVASGEAEVALASDTGGSLRIPAACCGVAGLKTTYDRVPVHGVWPVAPSLDTVGPIAADVSGLLLGMQLLEPGFAAAAAPAGTIGRLRTTGRPEIEDAVDAALRAAELEVVELDWDGFGPGATIFTTIFFSEMWEVGHDLVEEAPDGVGPDVTQLMSMAQYFRPGLAEIERARTRWRDTLLALFERVQLLALPTLPIFPPRLAAVSEASLVPTLVELTRHTSVFAASGIPCTAQPIPVPHSRLPASLQLVGPMHGEELLLATAARIEAAV